MWYLWNCRDSRGWDRGIDTIHISRRKNQQGNHQAKKEKNTHEEGMQAMMKHCRCGGGGGGGINQSGMECEGYLQGIEKMDVSSGTAPPVWRGGWMEWSSGDAALSRGGRGTEELAVLVGERGGTRARTPLRCRAFLSR